MVFYIDYTSGILGSKNVKFHGGGDFARFAVVHIFLKQKQKKDYSKEIKLIWPANLIYDDLSTEEKYIFDTYDHILVDSLSNIPFSSNDIIFFPLLNTMTLSNIQIVKKVNKDLRIYCVLHGIRVIDVCKFDKYDKFFHEDILRFNFALWSKRWFLGALAKRRLKKYLPLADRVYTVSNNSLQQILKYSKPQYIKYFLRPVVKPSGIGFSSKQGNEKYILFVSANRSEKNFMRALIAYCKYQIRYKSDVCLYVVGMNNILKKNMLRVHGVDKSILDNNVKFFEYVTPQQLSILYQNCQFLLYTSKSEGYGLPPLEAMMYGVPTVASERTSVPEVLGMLAYYVDPYCVESIAEGISYMTNDVNRRLYIEKIKEYSDSIVKIGWDSFSSFIDELFE